MYNIRAGLSVKWSFPSKKKRCEVLLSIIAHLEPYVGVSTLKKFKIYTS